MNNEKIVKALSEKIQDIKTNESMANHTSFKAGGCADIMVFPKSQREIQHAVFMKKEYGFPMFIMGRGTNLIVTSKGIRGVVLKLADNYSGMRFDGECVTAKSGTSLAALARGAMEHCLSGIEFLGGIPGTLGGAVSMNAGAYGAEIGDFVQEVFLATAAGAVSLRREEMSFSYRKSIISTMPFVVTGAKLKLGKSDAAVCKRTLSELNGKRRDKQPLEYPSAGSVFKRPEGNYAGALIEQAGLKGFSVGGAEVSEKHAGFIINKGGATPEDIIELIKKVRERVMQQSGVMLETEVKVIGER